MAARSRSGSGSTPGRWWPASSARRKFIYDLWGDTVNIASRLESHGIPGAIQISDATWSRVRGTVVARPRGPIELKGRGTVETFVIERRTEVRHGNVTGRA